MVKTAGKAGVTVTGSAATVFWLAGFAVVAAQVMLVDFASAQPKYPSQPVRIIVPYAPGGGADVMARVIAQKTSASLRHPVVVENRSGASGMMGSEYVARAAADGLADSTTKCNAFE